MRLSYLVCCVAILGLVHLKTVAASDIGFDIPAASYNFESAPNDLSVIADMGTKVGFVRTEADGVEYWGYENIDFGDGATHLTVRASSATQGGTLYVRLANHYNITTTVATVEITNTGGWNSFQDFTVEVDRDVIEWLGGRSLFFVVEGDGGAGYQFDVESFRFDDLSSPRIFAADFDVESYPSDDFIVRDMGDKVGYITNYSYIRFFELDLGAGGTTFSVSASSNRNGGTLYVTTGAPYPFGSDNVVAVVEIGPTGGWNDFQEFSAEVLIPTSGIVSNVYLSFEGDDGYLYDIESFRFE